MLRAAGCSLLAVGFGLLAACAGKDPQARFKITVLTGEALKQAECDDAPCRTGPTLHLRMLDGRMYDLFELHAPPVILRGMVSLFAGETASIETDPAPNGPRNPRLATGASPPERTMTIHFAQVPFSPQGTDMLLSVSNPYDRPLHYNLAIDVLDPSKSENFQPTDTVAIPPHQTAIEHWPYPIRRILIGEMRFDSAVPEKGHP